MDYEKFYQIIQNSNISLRYIDRVMMNGITKKDLNRGFFRALTETEIIRLKHF